MGFPITNKVIIFTISTIFLGVISSAIYDYIKKPEERKMDISIIIDGNNNDKNSINFK